MTVPQLYRPTSRDTELYYHTSLLYCLCLLHISLSLSLLLFLPPWWWPRLYTTWICVCRHAHYKMATLVESPQHQLTCRRVKDCCAQLYNTTQTWSTLSIQSFNVLNRLMDTLTEENCIISMPSSGGVNVQRVRLEGKLIEKRETLYSQLQESISLMVSLHVDRLRNYINNYCAGRLIMYRSLVRLWETCIHQWNY